MVRYPIGKHKVVSLSTQARPHLAELVGKMSASGCVAVRQSLVGCREPIQSPCLEVVNDD